MRPQPTPAVAACAIRCAELIEQAGPKGITNAEAVSAVEWKKSTVDRALLYLVRSGQCHDAVDPPKANANTRRRYYALAHEPAVRHSSHCIAGHTKAGRYLSVCAATPDMPAGWPPHFLADRGMVAHG